MSSRHSDFLKLKGKLLSQHHKIGELHARAWLQLGIVELRNMASFDQSNIQDDIRRSMYDARQEFNTQQESVRPPQETNQELTQER